MGLFTRRRGAWDFGPVKEQRSTLANPDSELLEALTTTNTAAGKRVTVKSALGLSPVWGAVSIIAEQVGQLPLKVYRDLDGEKVEAREHRAWRMLHDKPNPITPADRFWSTVTSQLLLWGNSYIYKRRNALGIVDELWLLDPARVQVEWDAEEMTKRFVINSMEGRQEFGTDEVLHIFGLSFDGIVGESVVGHCRGSLGAALARDEFEGKFYARGAVLSGVIEHPRRIGLDAAMTLKQTFMSLFSGSGKAHDVGVLEEGAQFKPMSHPLRDLEFVAAQNLSRTDIAVMFKLPPNMLGGSSGDSLTYATVEDNQLQFALHAIAPISNTIAKAISGDSGILPQNVYQAEFVLEAMLRANAKERADFYKTMSQIDAITVNEIRARENLPPLPGADRPAVTAGETDEGAGVQPALVNGNGNGLVNDAQ